MIPAGLSVSIDEPGDLATMRKLYPYATLAEHMMVGGVLFLRCHRCRVRPVPHHWHFAALCDPCLDDMPVPGLLARSKREGR